MSDGYPEEIVTRKADNRGRVHLGTDYADATVKVAVLEVSEDGE